MFSPVTFRQGWTAWLIFFQSLLIVQKWAWRYSTSSGEMLSFTGTGLKESRTFELMIDSWLVAHFRTICHDWPEQFNYGPTLRLCVEWWNNNDCAACRIPLALQCALSGVHFTKCYCRYVCRVHIAVQYNAIIHERIVMAHKYIWLHPGIVLLT